MKIIIAFATVFTTTIADELVFEDNFDKFDFTKWQHELTLGGGGNWEFQQYRNHRSNSFVKDGVLYIQPTLTSEAIGESVMKTGNMNIWGSTPADQCTGNAFYGCERNAGASGNYLNPIMSARLRTVNSFAFTYGKLEVEAQLPKGDWIWPAIWLLPKYNEFGNWPASGEIDLMESRGNDGSSCPSGNDMFGSTLHWGPNWDQNSYYLTSNSYRHVGSLSEEMHTYGMIWDADRLFTYIDTEDNIILDVDMTKEDFFTRGGYENQGNPWVGETNDAPFNRDFYIILNVAVGGTNGYFQDGKCSKPWSNSDPKAGNAFYNTKGEWYPSWNYPASHDAAMKINSVKVWQAIDPAESTPDEENSSDEDWYLAGYGENCDDGCAAYGLLCDDVELWSHNSEVDSYSELVSLINRLGGTVSQGVWAWGESSDVPVWSVDAETVYVSAEGRSLETLDCERTTNNEKKRLCYCTETGKAVRATVYKKRPSSGYSGSSGSGGQIPPEYLWPIVIILSVFFLIWLWYKYTQCEAQGQTGEKSKTADHVVDVEGQERESLKPII